MLGTPVVKVPPGWPLFLAGVIKVSTSFWWIGLWPMAFTLAAVAVWYRVLLRLTSPMRAFWLMLLVGILFHWHRVTFEPLSEGPFVLLLGATLLLGLQIAEGQTALWRLPLLLILCAGLVACRWASIIMLPVILGALLQGTRKIRLNLRWMAAALTVIVMTGTFFAQKQYLKGRADAARVPDTWPSQSPTVSRLQVSMTNVPGGTLNSSPPLKLKNLSRSGLWPVRLLWPVAEVGKVSARIALAFNVFGWLLIVASLFYIIPAARQCLWLWAGLVCFCAALFGYWSEPNGRYLCGIAPLIVLALWGGVEQVTQLARQAWMRTSLLQAWRLLLASIWGLNLAILAMNVRVARAADFYGAYQAGEPKELVRTAIWLNSAAARRGDVAVNDFFPTSGAGAAIALQCAPWIFSPIVTSVSFHIASVEDNPMRPSRAGREQSRWPTI